MARSSAAENVRELPTAAPPKAKRVAKKGSIYLGLLCAGFVAGSAATHEEAATCHPPPVKAVARGK